MTDDLVKQAIAELQDVVRCRCHPTFADRGLHDPDCECDSADAVKVVADRIEELQAERDEALNQLDSARHSVEVLEVNVARKNCEIKKLWIALSTYENKVREYASDDWARSDHAYDWLNEDAGKTARAARAALKGENQ